MDFSSALSKQFATGERTLFSVGFQKSLCGASEREEAAVSPARTTSSSWANRGKLTRGHHDLWPLAILLNI